MHQHQRKAATDSWWSLHSIHCRCVRLISRPENDRFVRSVRSLVARWWSEGARPLGRGTHAFDARYSSPGSSPSLESESELNPHLLVAATFMASSAAAFVHHQQSAGSGPTEATYIRAAAFTVLMCFSCSVLRPDARSIHRDLNSFLPLTLSC